MRYHELGRSGLQVSVVAMGCQGLGGDSNWGPTDEKAALATLHAAYDSGVNLFDTAESYGGGRSEELIGKAFSTVRDRILIASKVSPEHLTPAALRTACESSLRRLGTDYIDVYYIHWPSRSVDVADTLAELERLKAEGKVRAIGCSNFGQQDLAAALEVAHLEADQLPYSLLWRAVEYEVLPACKQHKISLVAYSVLLQGLLTGRYRNADEVPLGRTRSRHFSPDRPHSRHGEPGAEELTFETIAALHHLSAEAGLPLEQMSLAWPLHQQGVATVIAGARQPEQARANAAAADLSLSPAFLAALDEATAPLKERFGRNPDLWQNESRIR